MTDTAPTQLIGHCLCGEVRVTVTPGEDHLHACHCSMCRRWTGSALIGMAAAPESVSFEGPVRSYESSAWAARDFCERCGTTLWYRVTMPGNESYHISAGLFEDAGGMELTREIFIDRKPSGYAFAGDHETRTEAEMEAIFAAMIPEESE